MPPCRRSSRRLPIGLTIEQDFHDVKEVWGTGQQQVRNIWTNVAVYQLNLWMHALVELGPGTALTRNSVTGPIRRGITPIVGLLTPIAARPYANRS